MISDDGNEIKIDTMFEESYYSFDEYESMDLNL